MKRTIIKLCGLMSMADIKKANELSPDYIGYIFAHGRDRTVSFKTAKEMSDLLNEDIMPVGVFKNNAFEEVLDVGKSGVISAIQLHGKEDDSFISRLREKLNLPIIKSFGIAWPEDIQAANSSIADYVLLDTPGGGTGYLFDHDLLSGMKRDYFLAGGLSPNNVGECISKYHPYAVDVSSGIETDGAKDPRKMEAFVSAVREADRSY